MQRTSDPVSARAPRGVPGAPRGYALMAVIVMSALVLAGAAFLITVGRENDQLAIQQKRSTEAYGVATAGLQWMLANMSNAAGRDSAVLAATGTATTVDPGALNLFPFNADDAFAGVGSAPPPKGVSNASWTAVGNGHYGMMAAVDPLDRKRSVLIRAIGVVGLSQVVLESNLKLNIAQVVPSGITGCFPSDFQITFYDQEGPYDYTGNFRMDGGIGVPLAISADHNRINGLARDTGTTNTPAVPVDGTYVQGRQWRGTQSLRVQAIATGVSNRFGGIQSTNLLTNGLAPLALWQSNPYLGNDPRIADSFSVGAGAKGLALGDSGLSYDSGAVAGAVDTSAAATRQRGLPIIAFIGAPSTANVSAALGGFLGQAEWGGAKDDEARKGFYACDNHGGSGSTINAATEVCTKGSAGAGAPDWSNNAVNHSGRAYGFIQSILRQCTGSGSSIDPITGSPFKSAANANGIDCSNGFEWLENAAACLVLPRSVANASGTNALRAAEDAGGTANNFAGCHPGCLIATDINADGAISNEDRPFRSVCINLDSTVTTSYGPGALPEKGPGKPFLGAADPYAGAWRAWNIAAGIASADIDDNGTPARFAASDGTVRLGGAVRERGNGLLITRLDMSDRGPLGTCEQNCLAYGWGKDVTYSTPATAGTAADPNCTATVPAHAAGGGTTVEVCNMDFDLDGFLDRKSYALSSSYREDCADPHDGVAWAPAFNISSSNTNLGGTGCLNDMPGRSVATKPLRLVPFCEDGNDADLREGIDELAAQATVITSNELNKTTANLNDGAGWFGGARCHMGSGATFGGAALTHPHAGNLAGLNANDLDRLGHEDYWIEDTCPNPVVLKLDTNANVNVGKVCGCGVLIFTDNTLMFNGKSSFLWRGIVIWDMKTAGKELRIDGADGGTFVIEGAALLAGVQGMQIKITKKVAGGTTIVNDPAGDTVKQLYHLNPQAIADAFLAVKTPVRSMRRLR